MNANIVDPTKSRVLLGGIPIQIISLNRKPAYQTPLLINCCTYKNPFKLKHSKSTLIPSFDAIPNVKDPS